MVKERVIGAVLLAVALLSVSLSVAAEVWVLSIDGEIGRGTVSYLRKGLDEAAEVGASYVIIELATPGGLLDSAVAGRDAILDAVVPTVAYVNREALSAGALLAIACERIHFAPGGVLGAATPVLFEADGVVDASEKVVSATRSLFAATAEARGRPPDLAEAMVDRTVAVDGVVEVGRLLTLTAGQAATWGYSDGEAADLAALQTALGAADEPIVRFEPRVLDDVLATLTTRWVAAILLILGLVGLVVEMIAPGFGVAGVLGALCLGAFFWAHFLVGLAGWESIAFLLGGLFLVILEIFVLTATDFGLAGLAGLVLIGLGFYMAMVGPLTSSEQALRAIGVVSAGVLIGVIAAVVLIAKLPRTKLRFGGVILSSTVAGGVFRSRLTQDGAAPWVGRRGIAGTDLRPVGVGVFGDARVDVVSREGHLPKGTAIEVVEDTGFRKVVRRIEEGSES
jgi:membrane-bound serine protease (ClpP class)